MQNGDRNSLAVAEHIWQRNHQVDWEAAEVIYSSSDWFLECLIESWHIEWEPDPMNRENADLFLRSVIPFFQNGNISIVRLLYMHTVIDV